MTSVQPAMLLEEGALRVRFLPGRGSTLVVSFSGVGNARSCEPPIEFPGIASADGNNHVLFVTDQSRTWLNGPGMAAQIKHVIDEVVAQFGITRVVAVGNSMGGTMALLMSSQIAFDTVIALTPQYSVVPGAVPEEDRWMYFRKRIAAFTHPEVSKLRADRTRYVILHGDEKRELAHALRFPQMPGVTHKILPDCGHALARQLKDTGVLRAMIQDRIDGRLRRLRTRLVKAGAVPVTQYESKSMQATA